MSPLALLRPHVSAKALFNRSSESALRLGCHQSPLVSPAWAAASASVLLLCPITRSFPREKVGWKVKRLGFRTLREEDASQCFLCPCCMAPRSSRAYQTVAEGAPRPAGLRPASPNVCSCEAWESDFGSSSDRRPGFCTIFSEARRGMPRLYLTAKCLSSHPAR